MEDDRVLVLLNEQELPHTSEELLHAMVFNFRTNVVSVSDQIKKLRAGEDTFRLFGVRVPFEIVSRWLDEIKEMDWYEYAEQTRLL